MAPVLTTQFTSITDLQSAIQDGRTTVKKVVEGYLQEIDRLNGELNAVTAINRKAVEEAERLDVSDCVGVSATLLTMILRLFPRN